MIYTFKECKEKYGTLYMINKAVKNEELYKIEKGFYSDKPHEPEISLISLKLKLFKFKSLSFLGKSLIRIFSFLVLNNLEKISLSYSLCDAPQ